MGRFLKNTLNSRVLMFTKALSEKDGMVECDKDGNIIHNARMAVTDDLGMKYTKAVINLDKAKDSIKSLVNIISKYVERYGELPGVNVEAIAQGHATYFQADKSVVPEMLNPPMDDDECTTIPLAQAEDEFADMKGKLDQPSTGDTLTQKNKRMGRPKANLSPVVN